MLETGAVKGRLVAGRRPARRAIAALRRRGEATLRAPAWLSLLSVSLVGFAWWFIHAFALVPSVLLPGPGEVLATFI